MKVEAAAITGQTDMSETRFSMKLTLRSDFRRTESAGYWLRGQFKNRLTAQQGKFNLTLSEVLFKAHR